MNEPEVALAFTADVWVEELHRHLSDHGGARVRTLVVEPEVAITEGYDVLVTGHRWPALTRAVVADVHAHGRAVLGVHDREERASKSHLLALGVDALIESDAAPDAFVRAIAGLAATRPDIETAPLVSTRAGRLVVVGGAPGAGRTEIALQLAHALLARGAVTLVDADDVAPALAQRLALPIEPNLHAAIDTVEHGLGDLDACVRSSHGLAVLPGLVNAGAWAQVRPGEVIRVLERLADATPVVVVDGAGAIEDVAGPSGRARFGTARALVAEADLLLAVCDASPHGVTRALSWTVDARRLAPETPLLIVVNRAPSARSRRAELFGEIVASLPAVDVVFVPSDDRVTDAAWNGLPVGRGAFAKAVDGLADVVETVLGDVR